MAELIRFKEKEKYVWPTPTKLQELAYKKIKEKAEKFHQKVKNKKLKTIPDGVDYNPFKRKMQEDLNE